MAVQGLTLYSTQIGTLPAVAFSASLAVADLAAIEQSIADDQAIVSNSLGPNASAIQGGVIFHAVSTTSLTTLTSTSIASPSTATIAAITAGQYVYGYGIAPGTRILATGSGNTLHLSSAPTTGVSGGYFIAVGNRLAGCFSSNGFLNIPNRGVVKVFPGDVVAVDQSGWPILVSKEALAFAGSPWRLT